MPTSTATGSSRLTDSAAAAREALASAQAGLNGAPPAFALAFAGPGYRLDRVLAAVRGDDNGIDVIGCTTAGEITERGLTHDGVALLLVGSDELDHVSAFARGMKQDYARVAAELCRDFSATKALAVKHRRAHSTTLLLTDGLCGTGEKAIEEMVSHTGFFQQVVGGAAGDEGGFEATPVGAGELTGTDASAALHVFGAKPWGVGLGHGLQPSSSPMLVTRAEGSVVYELDGEPAFAAYQRHAEERGVTLSPEQAGPYMIGNELGIFVLDQVRRARAPLGVGEDGSLNCAAGIPEGASVCILDGEPSRMVEAARRAAEEAKEHLCGAETAGVLLFDCVCRGMILKEGFQAEIEAVRSVFGDVPVAGFLTYGEIARYGGRYDGWHNTTAVVVAIPR